MSVSSLEAPGLVQEQFERDCTHCGCRFSVTVYGAGVGLKVDFACPECGRPEPVDGALVEIAILAPRIDGSASPWRLPGPAEHTWQLDEDYDLTGDD